MSKVIGLVGHCGPDGYMLRSAVKYAVKEAEVRMVNDAHSLDDVLEAGADTLLLVNRVLDGGFDHHQGVELIRDLKTSHPQIKTMLISNYEDAQSAAEAAGA